MKYIVTLLFSILALYSRAQMQITTYNSGSSFSSIKVDTNNNIWAGRSNGVFYLNKLANPAAPQFTPIAGTSNFNVQALAVDNNGNVWAGHNGLGNNTAGGGGIERIPFNNPGGRQHYAPDRDAECFTFLARDGIATLNCFGLTVDPNGTVWSAHRYHDLTSPPNYILTPGTFSYKTAQSTTFQSVSTWQDYRTNNEAPELPYPAYTCNPSISQTSQTRNVYSVASGGNEVWVSVAAYTSKGLLSMPARLLKYNLNGTYSNTAVTMSTIGLPQQGYFNGIYVAPNGDVWTTISHGKGFAVRRNGTWKYVSTTNPQMSCVFPLGSGTLMNGNAIWGNKLGQVFIGTNNGLIVYRGTGPVDSSKSYSLYTTATHGLISNQILAGASEKDSIQWIATSNGIMSSTLSSNYPYSQDTLDYHYCNNPTIDSIENILSQNVTNRKDYHEFRVETPICSLGGPNGSKCNAQSIYRLIVQNANLNIPTPWDFPLDLPSPVLLRNADKAATTLMVNQYINAPNPPWYSSVGTNRVTHISDVLSLAYSLHQIFTPRTYPFVQRAEKLAGYLPDSQQSQANPASVVQCGTYKLYSSQLYIFGNIIYDYSIDDEPTCGDKLGNIHYNEVWVFHDDQDLTVTNYTKGGHLLYPGRVKRKVIEECGVVKVITEGTGLQYCGDNEVGKRNAIANIIVGSILFKNIDYRLKKAFESIP
jgi:hypothetical protein